MKNLLIRNKLTEILFRQIGTVQMSDILKIWFGKCWLVLKSFVFGLLIGLISYSVLVLNRNVSGSGGMLLTIVVFFVCAAIYLILIPLFLVYKSNSTRLSWKLAGSVIICGVVSLFVIFFFLRFMMPHYFDAVSIFENWLPHWPSIFLNSDLERLGIVYLAVSGVYVVSLSFGIESWRRRAWLRLFASLPVVVYSASNIVVCGWMAVFFE